MRSLNLRLYGEQHVVFSEDYLEVTKVPQLRCRYSVIQYSASSNTKRLPLEDVTDLLAVLARLPSPTAHHKVGGKLV